MSEGAEVHARKLLVQQARLFFFDGDVERFIQTGELDKKKPIPRPPAVNAKIAEIHANGGRLIID